MTAIVDFHVRMGAIDDLVVVTVKQITDDRGTIREVFRRSAFEAAGIDVDAFRQINVTESRRGVVRGMHAEQVTKLLTIASGEAFGAFVDLRPESATFGVVDTVELRPGTQVRLPPGVANGFQSLTEPSQYLYCFDREWQPGMAGTACTPLDPDLAIDWPLPIDVDDPGQLSPKDRAAPTLQELSS